MTVDSRNSKRQACEQALSKLAALYDEALTQSVVAIDAVARKQAQQQAEEIERRMDDLQSKLDGLALAPANPAHPDDCVTDRQQVHDLLQKNLHRIDFDHVEEAVTHVLAADTEQGSAGMLLFQQCSRMNGRLCSNRVGNLLKDKSGGLFHPLPIELLPGDRIDAELLLHRLASHLDVETGGHSQREQLHRVSKRLCGSLQVGSIALLEIAGCDSLVRDDPAALQWLVTEFWPRLMADLEQRVATLESANVSIILLLFFDHELPAGALAKKQCCTLKKRRRDKVLKVKLRNWTKDEVHQWINCWGMPGHPPDRVARIVEHVMRISEGLPYLISNELQNSCAAHEQA